MTVELYTWSTANGRKASIADMATLPWAARHPWHGVDLPDFPNVKRWVDAQAARPAVQRGMAIPEGLAPGWTPPDP